MEKLESSTSKRNETGIWEIKDNIAYRGDIEVPITDINTEIKEEIEKQNLAKSLFNAFKLVENNDINIIGYLYEILENSYNFLEIEDKDAIISRIEAIKNDSILDDQNNLFLNYFAKFLKEQKYNNFLEVFEEFKIYNKKYLIEPLMEEKASEIHR